MPTDSPLDAPKACVTRQINNSGTFRAMPAPTEPTHMIAREMSRIGLRPSFSEPLSDTATLRDELALTKRRITCPNHASNAIPQN